MGCSAHLCKMGIAGFMKCCGWEPSNPNEFKALGAVLGTQEVRNTPQKVWDSPSQARQTKAGVSPEGGQQLLRRAETELL